jgi:Kef-type K+ transport system membrane component KefB
MYTSLALVVLAGLLGPLLASGRRLRVPVLVGELIGGIILGPTLLHLIDHTAQPFPVFASLGFAMLMLESGTEIDLGSAMLRQTAVRAGLAFLATLLVAIPAGLLIGLCYSWARLRSTPAPACWWPASPPASCCASSASRNAWRSNSLVWQPASSSRPSSFCWEQVST